MIRTTILFTALLFAWVVFDACRSAGQTIPKERHQATADNRGVGTIYIDKIPCNAVMRTIDSTGNSAFYCYLVGFADSLNSVNPPGKKDIETGKYYQYDMPNDWTALVAGDSVKPVFFQSKQMLQQNKYEGILVFEGVKGKGPDTLIYTDSYGSWGTRQFIIHNNLK